MTNTLLVDSKIIATNLHTSQRSVQVSNKNKTHRHHISKARNARLKTLYLPFNPHGKIHQWFIRGGYADSAVGCHSGDRLRSELFVSIHTDVFWALHST